MPLCIMLSEPHFFLPLLYPKYSLDELSGVSGANESEVSCLESKPMWSFHNKHVGNRGTLKKEAGLFLCLIFALWRKWVKEV